ncbi:MAG: LLM class flavin-dependent oxidoreductase [Myxococcota bacterium]
MSAAEATQQDRIELGITPWDFSAGMQADRLAQQGERAEALGIGSFWLPENHFSGPGAIPQPLLWLGAVAARTRRLRLGTTSYLLPIRNPLQAAEEVAVLDRLSGGRVILGVGRGFRKALFEAFDVDVSTKRDNFEATLAVMQKAWSGESLTDGPGPPTRLAPLPVQAPHPPIWVAAFGPKALAQAGRLGLPYLASPMESLDSLVENYGRHRENLAEHDHDGSDLAVPIMRTVFAHPDPGVVGRVRDALTRQTLAMAKNASPALRRAGSTDVEDFALLGEPARVADAAARYREKLGMTHLIARTQLPGAEETELLEGLEHVAGLFA